MRATNVTGPVSFHGEGPCWSPSWGGLRFVDMLRGDLLTVRGDSVDRLGVGSPIAAFVRPRRSGGYVVGIERGIALADGAHEPPVRSVTLWDDPHVRMNEAAVAPDGGLFAGSMHYEHTPGAASLYRISPQLLATVEVPGVTISNGLAFSPDGSLAYYNDSATGQVSVFDVDQGNGGLLNRRRFVSIETGGPDGLTVDAEGNVWVALYGGSAVHGYSAEGTLQQVVELPASRVTACTFGGEDLRTLFITTSRENLADDQEPEAGSLFAVEVGTRGLPVVEFAG